MQDPFDVKLHESWAKAARDTVDRLTAFCKGSDTGDVTVSHCTRILHDICLSLVTSRDSYNLLHLNPPYNHADEDVGNRGGRLVYLWFRHTRLQPHNGAFSDLHSVIANRMSTIISIT